MKWIQRGWVAAVALACFTWLMSESDQTTVALLLSAAVVSSLGVPRVVRHAAARGGRRRVGNAAMGGCILGALVPLLAAAMMLVKVALHSHIQPDFSPDDLLAVLGRIPVWVIGAGLLGAAAGLASAGRPHPPAA
jgi:hypothetical protein